MCWRILRADFLFLNDYFASQRDWVTWLLSEVAEAHLGGYSPHLLGLGQIFNEYCLVMSVSTVATFLYVLRLALWTFGFHRIYQNGLKLYGGTFLVAQWLRLCAPNAGGPGSIPGQGTRSHMHAATKSLHATNKEPANCN